MLLEPTQGSIVRIHSTGSTVVRKIKQQRVVEEPLILQLPDNLSHPVIKMHQHRHERVPQRVISKRLDVFLGRFSRSVHCVIRHIEEKRLILPSVDKVHGLFRDACGQVSLFIRHRLQSLVDRMFRIRMIKVGMSPPSHEAVKLIESAIHGMTRHIESKVPFPVSTRDVPRFSHEHGNPFFIQRHPAATLTRCVDSEALLIATRHEPGASRRTDMTTRVAIGADHPISR